MFFRDVIGQESVKKRLIQSVRDQRISHAQLFSGSPGTGKLAMAIAYAQFISCKNRTEDDSCGTCPSCHKYNKLAHPDLHFVYPIFKQEGKDPVSDNFIALWREKVLANPYFELSDWLNYIEADNAQGQIYEKESGEILRKLNLKSFEAEYKIMIIWLPEKMHQNCSNKLLKIIEEPPAKTLFLLITEDEEMVISTIRSRSQIIPFPLIDRESMRKALASVEGIDQNMIADAVHLANGNYIEALAFINPDENEQFFFKKFQEMMRQAFKREIIAQMKWADEMSKIGRDQQKAFFAFALRLVREYFVMNLKDNQLNYLSQTEKEWGKQFAPFINEQNVIALTKEFELAIRHISANGNAKIIFLDTALRMIRLIKK